jgi:alpha-beta hydrolase superfamily lysophospholipase
VGHSFGGLLLFHALSQSLIHSVLSYTDPAVDLADNYADLVVLVNPAIEGSRFQPLFEAILARSVFPTNQLPVLVAVTAESDWTTK